MNWRTVFIGLSALCFMTATPGPTTKPAVASASAMTGPVDSPPSPATKLVLTIEAYKKAVVLYEPVTLTMRVKNPTAGVIKSNVYIDRLEFFITGPDGQTETCEGNEAARGDGILPEVTHEPGSVLVAVDDLGWKELESVFPVPGVYEIHARAYAGHRPTPVHLESNRLRIEVRQPSGVDSEAIAAFASTAEFKRLLRFGAISYCKGRDGTACSEQLQQFVDQHSASVYAPGVSRNLADSVSYGPFGGRSGNDAAIRLYKRFLQEWPDHPNASKVMFQLARTLGKVGRSGEAAEVGLEFEKKFPEQKEMAKLLRALFPS